MAKRVKKGFQMELRDGNRLAIAYAHDGKLRLEESRPHSYDAVDLTATQCEALGITAALEDVPEPWQVLRCAVLDAAGTITPEPPGECIRITERGWREAAAALGIEPEEE